jgi:hypothetical protein
LVVLGSFSNGQARWLRRSGTVVFVSDIDLMVVTPSAALDAIVANRDTITAGVARVERSVERLDHGFHIGVRYRSYAELGGFVQKTASVGYSFWEKARWIIDPDDSEVGSAGSEFGVGHCAENLCNLLLVALRYSRPLLERCVLRALVCMAASVDYLVQRQGSIGGVGGERGSACPDERLRHYGEVAVRLAQEYPAHCAAASHNEEFDFFRVSLCEPALLPRLLVKLLALASNAGNESLDGKCAVAAEAIAREMGVSAGTGEGAFARLLYSLAARRMDVSALFRRDRGPSYLASLRQY